MVYPYHAPGSGGASPGQRRNPGNLDRRVAGGCGSLPELAASGQGELVPGFLVCRGVDDDAQLGEGGDVQLVAGERQDPDVGVAEPAGALRRARDLLARPQLGELGAQVGQAPDVLLPVRLSNVPAVSGPQ